MPRLPSFRVYNVSGVLPAVAAGLLALVLAACAATEQPRAGSGNGTGATGAAATTTVERPPIVFVHGNGDWAGLWIATMWRFESNGWPTAHLHAINAPYPLSRDVDALPQVGRSSSAENRDLLAAEVDRVLARTGASRVVLIGNSRGGNAIRDFIRNGGGAAKVSHAILGGTPNHGVWARADYNPGNEFNGTGPFLTALNLPQGPDGEEVTPGVQWMTVRSDGNDKYAQPTGEWIGQPKLETRVGANGPALKGARNVVLPGADHREVSYHALAFEQAYAFLKGGPPPQREIVAQARVVLDGLVAGHQGASVINLPLAGARMDVYRVSCASGERSGPVAHARVIGADGRWGPFETQPEACHEFVVDAPGYATTHVYRSAFPRSSTVVHFRPMRMTDADRAAGSVHMFTRPRGYFDVRRDRMSLDGGPVPGIQPGVAGLASSRLALPAAAGRTVVAEFNGERIAARTWPATDNHLSVAELHY